MDFYTLFHKKVIDHYKIHEILIPGKKENGVIENSSLTELRKKLDLCFHDIQYTFQEYLTEYLQEYIIELWSIIDKQNIKVKKLEAQTSDEVNIEIQANLEWNLEREKFILFYHKELQFFLRDWISEKRQYLKTFPKREKEKEDEIKRLINEEMEKITNLQKNKYPDKFLNTKSYLLFKNFTEDIYKNELAEYSFIYRKMIERGFIYNTVKPNMFRDWLNDEFQITLDKLKTLSSISTIDRDKRFNQLVNQYKL